MTAGPRKFRIALLPGDGIGPEVVSQAVRVLEAVAPRHGIEFSLDTGTVGGAAIDKTGEPLPAAALEVALGSDAVLLGAVGGPNWDGLPYEVRPERALLGLREHLGLYGNLRPVRLYPMLVHASTLRPETVEGVDLVVVRELTGGIYFGRPRGIEKVGDHERGVNTEVYTTPEIERIARLAFEVARGRRKKVTSVDKANVLESSELWRKVVTRVHAAEYSDVALEHLYVDNCAMQLVRAPRQFDVILTTNMFGDILSDEAAMLTGSIGMLPSASLGGKTGLYEPIHGSAPDIAGQDRANPIAAILSVGMLLRYTCRDDKAADEVEQAVLSVLAGGYRTPDLLGYGTEPGMRRIGTHEMGDRIVARLRG